MLSRNIRLVDLQVTEIELNNLTYISCVIEEMNQRFLFQTLDRFEFTDICSVKENTTNSVLNIISLIIKQFCSEVYPDDAITA